MTRLYSWRTQRALLWICAVMAALWALPARGAGSSGLALQPDECTPEFSILAKVRGISSSTRTGLKIVFNYHDDGNCLALEVVGRRAHLVKCRDGKATPLAGAVLPAGASSLVIKRRLWRISLLVDGRLAARGYDTEMTGGRTGWKTAGGVTCDFHEQATEPVYFADDFTRGPNEAGEWALLAGKGQVAEIEVGNHQGTVGRYSSNAFSWVMQAQPVAVATTGYWFWDDYAVEASVRPETRGAVGLIACLKDGSNFLLFRWTGAQAGRPGSGVREIIRVLEGKPKVLVSEPGGFEPQQWYRLRFIACEGNLSAYVDGQLVCSARDEMLTEGKIALYARDTTRATFDDVRVVGTDAFREPFDENEPQKWEDAGIAWRTDTKARRRIAEAAGEGVTIAGRPDWRDYTFAADADPGKADSVGLAFAYRSPKRYFVFRVPARRADKARIVEMQDGKPTVMGESTMPVVAGEHARLKVALAGGHAKGYLNDQPVVDAFDVQAESGRLGLYASGPAGAAFSNATAVFHIEDAPPAKLDSQFTQEATMAGWANPRGSWRPANGTYWHVGDFYGSPSIKIDLPAERAALFHGSLILNADDTDAESGYRLTVRMTGRSQADLELRRKGQVVGTKSGEWRPRAEGGNRQLRFWRSGAFVSASLGDDLTLSYRDPAPLTGTRVGLQSPYAYMLFPYVEATTTNVVDTTFSGPPTDWWGTRGVWDVVQRWPCDNRWSFFGGLKSESPMLWTKQSFSGDVTVEAWVALYMDNIEDEYVGYKHPSDLNLAFCTDGKDLSSGYSCLFAACSNTCSRVMRKDKVVAETDQVRMIDPRRLNLVFQRHWFYLRAEKRGSRIRFWVDDLPAGDFTDPNPLPGGQVALWSWKNGLMVARARIWYEKEGPRAPLPIPAVEPCAVTAGKCKVVGGAPVALAADWAAGTDGWTTSQQGEEAPVLSLDKGPGGEPALRVTNRVSGGDVGVLAGVKEFDAAKFPMLRFDYRISEGTKINLYCRSSMRQFCVHLTAPGMDDPYTVSLGSVPGVVADGKWHSAEVNLGALLRRQLSDGALTVDDLCFRAPDVEYLRSGFGGNLWGAEYALANFRLVGSAGAGAADAKQCVLRK